MLLFSAFIFSVFVKAFNVGMDVDDLFRFPFVPDKPLPCDDDGDDSLLLLQLLLLLLLLLLSLLFGFGGKAGRDLSNGSVAVVAAPAVVVVVVDKMGVELIFGATAWTRGLGMVDFTEGVIDVGATLLIGFRGGTTKLPDGI